MHIYYTYASFYETMVLSTTIFNCVTLKLWNSTVSLAEISNYNHRWVLYGKKNICTCNCAQNILLKAPYLFPSQGFTFIRATGVPIHQKRANFCLKVHRVNFEIAFWAKCMKELLGVLLINKQSHEWEGNFGKNCVRIHVVTCTV